MGACVAMAGDVITCVIRILDLTMHTYILPLFGFVDRSFVINEFINGRGIPGHSFETCVYPLFSMRGRYVTRWSFETYVYALNKWKVYNKVAFRNFCISNITRIEGI